LIGLRVTPMLAEESQEIVGHKIAKLLTGVWQICFVPDFVREFRFFAKFWKFFELFG
jgi:hypothetical protein